VCVGKLINWDSIRDGDNFTGCPWAESDRLAGNVGGNGNDPVRLSKGRAQEKSPHPIVPGVQSEEFPPVKTDNKRAFDRSLHKKEIRKLGAIQAMDIDNLNLRISHESSELLEILGTITAEL